MDKKGKKAHESELFQVIKEHVMNQSTSGTDLTDVDWSAIGGIVLWAALMGQVTVLQELIQSYDSQRVGSRLADYADYDKRTALHLAAAGGQDEVCRYLLEEARVRPNPVDRWGYSPLDDAERFARRTGRWSTFNLLKREYEGRPGPGNEETAMIKAAYFGDAETVERYAQARFMQGKDVNPADYDDRTPLHLAASQGHWQVVQALLGQGVGASPNVKDRWNRRPVDDAQDGLNKYTKAKDTEKMENFQKCIDALQKSGTSATSTPRCFLCGTVKATYHDVTYKGGEDEKLTYEDGS